MQTTETRPARCGPQGELQDRFVGLILGSVVPFEEVRDRLHNRRPKFRDALGRHLCGRQLTRHPGRSRVEQSERVPGGQEPSSAGTLIASGKTRCLWWNGPITAIIKITDSPSDHVVSLHHDGKKTRLPTMFLSAGKGIGPQEIAVPLRSGARLIPCEIILTLGAGGRTRPGWSGWAS